MALEPVAFLSLRAVVCQVALLATDEACSFRLEPLDRLAEALAFPFYARLSALAALTLAAALTALGGTSGRKRLRGRLRGGRGGR